MRKARTLPEIVRGMAALRERHEASLAAAMSGTADAAGLDALAETDAELSRFEDMCVRTTTHHLMSSGLRWDDELRHPSAAGDVARVRLRDRVAFRGHEVTIMEATRMLTGGTGAGPAVADWTGPRGIRLGDALRLEHPARTPEIAQDAQASLF
jgi:hypothetical protein